MRDFPPDVTTFYTAPGARPATAPDTRTPGRFLWWMLGQQWELIVISMVMAVLWQLPLTLGPWLFGKAVDQGILAGSWPAVAFWAAWLLVVTLVGALFGIL
ncbi:MAG: ABC transporter ATP-binding protein, partial [Nocardioides sp.]